MKRYVLGRTLQALICVIVVATTVFVITRLTGNPLDVLTDPRSTAKDRELVAQKLGLDKPLIVQYVFYMASLAKGDFGKSFNSHRPALEIVLERFPATLELAGAAMLLTLIIAIPIGVYAAVQRGKVLDTLSRTFAFMGQAAPIFWTGIMAILIFSVKLGLLPSSGRSGIASLVLPAASLGWLAAAGILRITRSSMLDILGADYIKMARAKGLSEGAVIWKHAFKNAALPILTFFVLLSVMLISGAVVTETVFAWPGLGRLMMYAVQMRDFPIVQTVVILLCILYIGANLLVDILYAWLNPRIRY